MLPQYLLSGYSSRRAAFPTKCSRSFKRWLTQVNDALREVMLEGAR